MYYLNHWRALSLEVLVVYWHVQVRWWQHLLKGRYFWYEDVDYYSYI